MTSLTMSIAFWVHTCFMNVMGYTHYLDVKAFRAMFSFHPFQSRQWLYWCWFSCFNLFWKRPQASKFFHFFFTAEKYTKEEMEEFTNFWTFICFFLFVQYITCLCRSLNLGLFIFHAYIDQTVHSDSTLVHFCFHSCRFSLPYHSVWLITPAIR